MIQVQLDFFKSEEECRDEAVLQKVKELEESCTKVRKKLFACNGEIYKLVMDIQERLSVIERNICHGK